MDLIERAKVERITFQEPSYSDPINVLTEVRDKVRALPAVDAIPVKWIEQYGRENWYDFGTQYNAITEMLKAWRKKNEESICNNGTYHVADRM